MLVFITSVRHPLNSRSFTRVKELLDYSLASVLSQKCSAYKVIVVSNAGTIDRIHDTVHYIEVNFPPPSVEPKPNTGMSAIQIDRGTKYAAALLYAKRFSPDYIMFFDCDDLIHNEISAYVKENVGEQGWYIDKGFSLRIGSKSINPMVDFHKHCGTSHILRYDALLLPTGVDHESSQKQIIESFGKSYIKSMLGGHRLAIPLMRKIKIELKPLPFAGAIWVLGHGENHSGRQGKEGTIVIDNSHHDLFCIPDTYVNQSQPRSV